MNLRAALVALAALGCGRVKPGVDAAPMGRAQVLAGDATVTEEVPGSGFEQLQLEISVANAGGTAVNGVAVSYATIRWSGFMLEAIFALDPKSDGGPIAPGETRKLLFDAAIPRLQVCGESWDLDAGVRRGVVELGARVISNVGGWALAGIDVAVTCVGPSAQRQLLPCAHSLADGCATPDMMGNPLLACLPTWQQAMADRCAGGPAISEGFTTCGDGLKARTLYDGVSRTYFYDAMTDALIAVTTKDPSGRTCLAGPSDGFVLPPCPSLDATQSCYQPDKRCFVVDAGGADCGMTDQRTRMPQPDEDGGVMQPPDM